jgi:two-component system phosphate regulon sensor histidine kinase PhoR
MTDVRSRHRLQLLLFIAAILLPSVALVEVGQRTLRQNRELEGKRRLDQRRAAKDRIARDMLARLEGLKRTAAADFERPLDPAIAMVAPVQAGRMLLPWETPSAPRPATESSAARERGQQAEFGGKPAGALESYTEALRLAATPYEANYARYLLAAALNRQRRVRESAAEARRVVDCPLDLVDEDGVPLAVLAARLLTDTPEGRATLRRTLTAAIERRRWPSPTLTTTFAMAADQLQQVEPAEDPAWLAGFRQRLAAQNRMQEQAQALEEDSATAQPASAAAWRFHAFAEPWLVSLRPAEGNPALVIGVRARDVFAKFEAAGDVASFASTEPGSELLGDAFPGLTVRFTDPDVPAPSGIAGAFYYAALLVLVAATAFGASLLWRSLRREVELAETRSQFVASVSHELKTPLTAIRMYAETLEMGRSQDEEVRREYLETICHECERLSRLVDDVLLFSKIEQGKAVYRFRRVALPDLLDKAARALSYPLAQHGFELRMEIGEDVPPVKGDSDALEQAILNLLTNAIKYSGERKEIVLRLARGNGQAAIQVTDYGLGIAAADLPHIFDKYYRASNPENRAIPGTGLGLTLVAQIAKAHGGTVEVKSVPGAGSTFTLRLPIPEELS